MDQYVIKGGNPLVGEVEIGGAKNAALAILAAAIMTDETVVVENLPVSYTHLSAYRKGILGTGFLPGLQAPFLGHQLADQLFAVCGQYGRLVQ